MEEDRLDPVEQEAPAEEAPDEKNVYKPRPLWQVWAARIGLVLFILVLLLYYINIMRGAR